MSWSERGGACLSSLIAGSCPCSSRYFMNMLLQEEEVKEVEEEEEEEEERMMREEKGREGVREE